MDNNKIETLLMQILENQASMQSDIKELTSKVDSIKDQIIEFEAKTATYHIETLNNFNEVNENIDFLTHKESQTEKEVYSIKKKLQVIK